MKSDPIRDAASAIGAGGLIILPTDTVYGLASRPDDPIATGRIFDAKARARELELPVLCATEAQAREVAMFDHRADALALASWPGGLTLVLARAEAARGWDLGGDPETVGVRVPSHPLTLAVLALTGPMAVTSANRSGQPPAATCDELVDTFGDLVDMYLCSADPLSGAPSTVVDLAHGPATIIREGGISRDQVRKLLPPGDSLLDSRPSS
ncbi:MAG TPA: L-threonylcarbamoyladenylate synthase [Actinomycetota bacterium]